MSILPDVETPIRAARPDTATLRSILEAAITAPSPDNVQSWRFRPTSSGFVILHDRRRGPGLGRGATKDVAYLLAVGALVEAARIKAKSLGFDVHHCVLDPDALEGDLEPWVHVRLLPGEAEHSRLVNVLAHRYSHRGPFLPVGVKPEELETLERLSTQSVVVHTTADRATIDVLSDLAARADQMRAENQLAHEDLHEWLRWTAEEAERTRDGLDVRTLGLETTELAALRFLRPWSRMKRLIPLGASRVQGRYGGRIMRSSPALGWIVVPSLERDVLVEAGAIMERVWLGAAEIGIALSPLSVLALLPLMATTNDPMLSSTHVRALRCVHSHVHSALGLKRSEQVVFFFRLGRANPPPVRALRRLLDDFILDASRF